MPTKRPAKVRQLAKHINHLQQQLVSLLENARENEEIFLKIQRIELDLVSVSDFAALAAGILHDLKEAFALDAVVLNLVDTQHDLQAMLAELNVPLHDFKRLQFLNDEQLLQQRFATHPEPVLGRYDPSQDRLFFYGESRPASVALLPLWRQQRLLGCLALGSRTADHFRPEMATDFIERLSAIVAICLENVINSERLKHIGLTDPLTGVHNRRYFDQRLVEEVQRTLRQGTPLSCLFLDIDFFKKINDTYGHQVGDEVLREVAQRVKQQLRVTDTLGRYGGEEFAALLVQTDLTQAAIVAERVRGHIAATPVHSNTGQDIIVTMSIGVAHLRYTDPLGQDIKHLAQQMVAHADEALYAAKANGRNRIMTYPATQTSTN